MLVKKVRAPLYAPCCLLQKWDESWPCSCVLLLYEYKSPIYGCFSVSPGVVLKQRRRETMKGIAAYAHTNVLTADFSV